MKLNSSRLGGPALLLGLLVLLLAVGGATRASAADVNTIQSITNVAGPAVDIALTSTRAFGVRDDLLTLQIGTATFTLSRFPADGTLTTVTFTLTPAQFAATTTGDPVTIYYSSGAPTDTEAWQFGTLNKKLLKTGPVTAGN